MRILSLLSIVPLYYTFCSSTSTIQPAVAQGSQIVLNAETDAFINQVLSDWNSPGGVGVAVVRMNNQGVWDVETKGYGVADANGAKVTENTRFAIGSNSKLFTVLATGLLINNVTLSPRLFWTTKIASIIPFWGLIDPVATKQANILDVMSHRTGLPRHDASYKWSDDVPAVIKKLKYQRPSAEFRDVWQYNNNMYTLLSYLPTLLLPSKIPFARYVKQHILDPLGMTSTTYSYEVANATGQLASGMTKQGVNISEPFGNGTVRAFPYWSTSGGEDGNLMSGDGGMISTAVDMATWLQTLLLGGIKPGTNQSVIPPDALERAAMGITVASGVALFPELSPVVYGGGQTRISYRGHELVEHGGSIGGFNSQISRLTNDNIGIAVLTNDDLYGTLIAEVIKGRILDGALGLEPVDWNGRYRSLISANLPSAATVRPMNASLPSVNITSIVGTYTNRGYGDFELCSISINIPTASKACKALASSLSTILPGAVVPNVPTFLAAWNSPAASHVRLTHFNGNVFNVTGLTSYATGNPSEPFWTYGNSPLDTGIRAEFAVGDHHIGLGLIGIWGAGVNVPGLEGKTVRERAEVWFDKV